MNEKKCCVCSKENLSKNEIGLTKKLLSGSTKYFYCLNCLAEYLEIEADFLLAKAEEFKEQGCKQF
jgi:hypothetical protein